MLRLLRRTILTKMGASDDKRRSDRLREGTWLRYLVGSLYGPQRQEAHSQSGPEDHREGVSESVATARAGSQDYGPGLARTSKCESGERRVDVVDLQDFARLYRKDVSYFMP
jgi:hypothetical protein